MSLSNLTLNHGEGPATSWHLLIVDDGDINRRMLCDLFAKAGYQTSTAENGEEALACLASTSFDLVLLDVMMPVMDGLTALRHIRNNPETATLPVVLISAMSDTKDIVHGLELGANDYLTKPVRTRIALARIKTQLMLRALLNEREQTIAQMEENRRLRERFFQMASHDLKQPLMSLKVANVLLADLIDKQNTRARGVLETVDTTVETMTDIVTVFLDSAMVQGGALEINIQPVDVRDLVWASVSQQKPSAFKKGIQIIMDVHSVTVACDPVRFAQVLNNLVSNAVKYSPAGGTVHVTLHERPSSVRVQVTDQGAGVPPTERPQLFQPFSRLSSKPTAGESSHGLGLWIAKQLIDLQHGDIGATFPAAGSVFWVDIPKPTT